jgi:hypothetical protein
MALWPKNPTLYEINTWVWLHELSQTHGTLLTLATVPDREWDAIALPGIDAIWLMGVWERSPEGIRITLQDERLVADFQRALPDFSPEDNIGSPYSVRRYVVDEHLGGPAGLAVARKKLSQRGIHLVLDFVPNHVAPDHPWVSENPDYFIRGNEDELKRNPGSFVGIAGRIFSYGRDPYFPSWPDVLQLNAFHPGLRRAALETVSRIAGQCDGLRCDMAMLVMNTIFERTWGSRAGRRPVEEYWPDLIRAVRHEYPDVLFLAEAYWELEWDLQQQGFDYCYDKRLYDRLVHDPAENVRQLLCADRAFQNKLVRFIENHDEPRAASTFSHPKEHAVALTMATLPGASLFHEGQFEGRKVKTLLSLGRRPHEFIDSDLQTFYTNLLKAAGTHLFKEGDWTLCERTGWPDNASYRNVLAWCWYSDAEKYLIAVNLSESAAQARVRLPWNELKNSAWRLTDVLSGAVYERNGDEMCDPGLYVDLPPWGYHFLECQTG